VHRGEKEELCLSRFFSEERAPIVENIGGGRLAYQNNKKEHNHRRVEERDDLEREGVKTYTRTS